MHSPPSSIQRLRQEMRARAEATRPQLARACGLSLVTVNRVVARLCASGEWEAAGEVSSGGGRPVQLYRLRRASTRALLLHVERSSMAGILHCKLEFLDPLGSCVRQEEARFAHLDEGVFDGWLDGLLPSQQPRLLGITLSADSPPLPPALCRHLSVRYHCPCQQVSAADALVEWQDGSCTVVFPPGAAPLATLYRNGTRLPCTALELLPLPAAWDTLDSSDHTLLEEMVARLLLTLSCILTPERFVLYGNFWSERLQRRIRYNLGTKLKNNPLPALSFRRFTPRATHDALCRLALEVG